MNPIWFTVEDVENENNEGALLAIGLTNWANCMAGNTPPEYFGEMMVVIGKKLGIAPTPENVKQKADEWTKNHK